MKINDETRNVLRLILLDHRDCLRREDYPMCSGKEVKERLRRHGIETNLDEAEIDSKANLLWQLDELVELLEKGEDQ